MLLLIVKSSLQFATKIINLIDWLIDWVKKHSTLVLGIWLQAKIMIHPVFFSFKYHFSFSFRFGGIFVLVLTFLYVNVVRLMTTLSK